MSKYHAGSQPRAEKRLECLGSRSHCGEGDDVCDRPEDVAEEPAKGDLARCRACWTAEFFSELPAEGTHGFTHSAENHLRTG